MPWSTVRRLTAAASTVPTPVDTADRWLLRAAQHLAAACGLAASTLPSFADPELRPLDVLVDPGTAPSPGDAALAALLAAAAVEARLNRTLRLRDPADWHSVAHLSPPEKLGLAPRLLHELEPEPLPSEHDELADAASTLFAVRAGLVEDAELEPPDASRAGGLVETAARICAYLSRLADDEAEDAVAAFVERVAELLRPRARAVSGSKHDGPRPSWSWTWSSDTDFPPDLVGS